LNIDDGVTNAPLIVETDWSFVGAAGRSGRFKQTNEAVRLTWTDDDGSWSAVGAVSKWGRSGIEKIAK